MGDVKLLSQGEEQSTTRQYENKNLNLNTEVECLPGNGE